MTSRQAEEHVARYLADNNRWVHIIEKTVAGQQPFDIIAIRRDGLVWALDVKHCKRNFFTFSRIRENQKNSLSFLSDFTDVHAGFAIVHKKKIYYLPYWQYEKHIMCQTKSVRPTELQEL